MSAPPVLFSPRWWRILRLILREFLPLPAITVRLRFYRTACVYLTAMWAGLILRGSSGGRLIDAVLFVFAIGSAVLSAESERRRRRQKGLHD